MTLRGASLAADVHVVATTVDPVPPKVDLSGIEDYMQGLVEFARAGLSGTTRVSDSLATRVARRCR
jgi:hypothetical protein